MRATSAPNPDPSGGAFTARIENRVAAIADWIAHRTRLFAYGIAMLAWSTIGLIAWLAVLLAAIVILVAVMVFRLVGGLRVEREATRFFSIVQFWPDGFTSLTHAFWSEDHRKKLQAAVDDQVEPSNLFAAARIAYVALVIYLVVCLIYDSNPLTYVFTLPINSLLALGLIVALTLGMAYAADFRKIAGRLHISNKNSTEDIASDEQKPKSPTKRLT